MGAQLIRRGIMNTLIMMTSTRTLLTEVLLTSISVKTPTGRPSPLERYPNFGVSLFLQKFVSCTVRLTYYTRKYDTFRVGKVCQ